MTSKIYNCSLCKYNSNKKFNFNRHMVSIHKINDVKNTTADVKNTTADVKNTTADVKNTTVDVKNTTVDVKNATTDTKCFKCSKIFSSKNYLQKHLIICKGVSNHYECHLCHKMLANSGSKSRHIKICKATNSLVVYNNSTSVSSSDLSSELTSDLTSDLTSALTSELESLNGIITKSNTSNIISNSNIITNSNNNNTNITYNIVVYNEYDEKINFDISHLDKDIAYKLSTKYFESAFTFFCNKLFENKNNQLIIKENFKYSHSKIHTGFKIWITLYDKYIYPIVMTNISETMLIFIETYNLKTPAMKSMIGYLDSMATKDGYSATKTAEYKKNYNIHINQLKILFNKFMEKK